MPAGTRHDDPVDEFPSVVSKHRTPAGRVGTAVPQVLRDTSRSRIEVLPWYIPRTAGEQVALKLTREELRGDEERVEITLRPDEVAALHSYLHVFLSLAVESDDAYLIVPVSGEGVLVADETARKLSAVLRQEGVAERLAELSLTSDAAATLQVSVRAAGMRGAIESLREHLDVEGVREDVFQDWCAKHTWAFGNAYVARDEVREIGPGDTIDVLLKPAAEGLRDVIELKRADMRVLNRDRSHKTWYWTADVSAAIGQCHRYLDTLHKYAAKGLDDHPEIVAYHPRATIVIGRSADWTEDQQRGLRGLNARLHSITVMTYDHLLAQAEATLATLTPGGDVQGNPAVSRSST